MSPNYSDEHDSAEQRSTLVPPNAARAVVVRESYEVALCTFDTPHDSPKIGRENQLWALRLDGAREIVKPPPITRVPRVDASIRGLFLLRGRLVTLVDLGARLGLRALRTDLPWNAPQRRAILMAGNREEHPGDGGSREPGSSSSDELLAFGVDAIVGVERVTRAARNDAVSESPFVDGLVATSLGPALLLVTRAIHLPGTRVRPLVPSHKFSETKRSPGRREDP